MPTIPIQINIFGARNTIFRNEQFKNLKNDAKFENIWHEFIQDVNSWANVDYYHETTVIDLKTLDYLIDRWFKTEDELEDELIEINKLLKQYFNNTQHFTNQ